MFIEKIRKIIYGFRKGKLEERFRSPEIYSPGEGKKAQAPLPPEKIYITKEYIINPTLRNIILFAVFLGLFFYLSSLVFKFLRFDVNKVKISLEASEFIPSGKTFDFKLVIRNQNRRFLENAVLEIFPPKEILYLSLEEGDLEKKKDFYNFFIGEIPKKSIKELHFKAIVLSQKDERLPFKFRFYFYNPLSLSNTYREFTYFFTIADTPVEIVITKLTPTLVYNQNVKLSFKIKNSSELDLKDLKFLIKYPTNFNPINFSIIPTISNNIWIFREFSKNEEKEIIIEGFFSYVESQKEVGFSSELLYKNIFNEEVSVGETSLISELRPPPLVLSINSFKAEIPEKIISPNFIPQLKEFKERDGVKRGENILIKIKVKNTLNVSINDIKLEVSLSNIDKREISFPLSYVTLKRSFNDPLVYKDRNFRNPSYNLKIFEGGYYISQSNKIIWDKSNYPAFFVLSPSEEKEVNFLLKIKKEIPITSSNNQIKSIIIAKVYSERIPYSAAGIKIEDKATYALKLNTDLGVKSSISKESPYFENKGPLPLQENVKTTFVVKFEVFNSYNYLQDFILKAKLNDFVDFESGPYPSQELLEYNALTNEVIWRIPKINPGTGYYNNKKFVYFQISITPSKDLPFYYPPSQIQQGLYPPIVFLKDIKVQANDNFFNKKIGFSLPDIKYKTYIIR